MANSVGPKRPILARMAWVLVARAASVERSSQTERPLLGCSSRVSLGASQPAHADKPRGHGDLPCDRAATDASRPHHWLAGWLRGRLWAGLGRGGKYAHTPLPHTHARPHPHT